MEEMMQPVAGLCWSPRLGSRLLARTPLPRRSRGLPPSLPAERQVGQLGEAAVPRNHAPQADDHTIGDVEGASGEELPAAIVSLMDDEEDRLAAVDDLTRGDRGEVRRVSERPFIHD